MSERIYANIKPELLVWARQSAGLSLEQAARKLGLSKSDRLDAFEKGDLQPTVGQLRKAARVYKRPLSVFFLRTPPESPPQLHDFRRLPGQDVPPPSPELLLEMRRARRRRHVALELMDELGHTSPELPIRADLKAAPEAAAAEARRWFGVTLEQQRQWTGEYDGLNRWSAILESRGVLVFQTGDISLDEVRGFSISEEPLPVIVLNGKDSPRARVFTLMHEFAHLMLNLGGVCEPFRVRTAIRSADERVEVFCNRVAGAILVPGDALDQEAVQAGLTASAAFSEPAVRSLAESFAVSREVILLRLLSLGRISGEYVTQKFRQYRREYAERAAETVKKGFAPPFRLAIRDNGRRFTRLVLDALDRERITLADVSDYLGVRLKHLESIAEEVRANQVQA